MEAGTEIAIRLGEPGSELVFVGPAFAELIVIRLDAGAVQASDEILLEPSLPAYFADLHELWRGWDGDRAWHSVEGNFALAARHDRVGHVSLAASLGRLGSEDPMSPRHPGDWILTVVVAVEPAYLGTIATQLRELL